MKRLILLCILTAATASSVVYSRDLTFSMLPRYYPERLTQMMGPFAKYLSRELAAPVEAILTDDFADYEKRVNQGEIPIAYENPLVYTRVSKTHHVVAMAMKGEDGDKFRGIIITRPDSRINHIENLRGKSVMIVSETSAGGFLSQKLSLMERGVDVNRDMFLEVASNNKQENVIISVSVGDVEAGFIRESALHVADKYIVPGSVKVLAPTAWLPNWALSVDKSLTPEVQDKVKTAVLALKADNPALVAMGLNGFRPADDSDYDVIRKVVE